MEELQKRARERLKQPRIRTDLAAPINESTDLSALVDALQLHQSELEIQNENLICAQNKLASALKLSTDLYDLAPVAYVTIGSKGQILSVNQLACKLFEAPNDELINSSLPKHFDEESSEEFYLHCRFVLDGGENATCELELHKRLQARHVRLDTVLVEGVDDSEPTLRVAITDITNQRQLAEKREAEQRIQSNELIKTLGVIAGGVAHDVNNFMTPIVIQCELAKMSVKEDSSVSRNLAYISEAAHNASAVCQQLLSFSGSGSGSVPKSPIQTTAFVEKLFPLIKTMVPPAIELKIKCDSPISSVYGDEVQIKQVLINLISNAVDAIGDDRGSIEISVSEHCLTELDFSEMSMAATNDPGAFIAFTVSDDGCGMDKETLLRIFNPYFTTKVAGRGLGMSSVMGIARDHFAAIKIDTDCDRGTHVSVYFPAINDIAASDEPSEKSEAANLQGVGSILIVDDDELVRKSIVALLQQAGYTTHEAASGSAAVEIYQKHLQSIDLVLLDLVMPEMDGVKTLDLILQLNHKAKLIIVSGYANSSTIEKIESEKINGFIRKPFTAKKLLSDIQHALAR